MRRWLREAAVVLAVGAGVGLSGCASAPVHSYLNPDADLSYYERVGVVPFVSLAADRFAGEKFTAEFTTALLATELFDVVEFGIFVNALKQVIGSRSPADGLSTEDLDRIGQATGVQGVFEGTISEYEMTSSPAGRYPLISVEARLVDVATGTVVWKASVSEKGGPKTPIIGMGETKTLGALGQKLSQRLVNKLK
jgi:TolB-like protein